MQSTTQFTVENVFTVEKVTYKERTDLPTDEYDQHFIDSPRRYKLVLEGTIDDGTKCTYTFIDASRVYGGIIIHVGDVITNKYTSDNEDEVVTTVTDKNGVIRYLRMYNTDLAVVENYIKEHLE